MVWEERDTNKLKELYKINKDVVEIGEKLDKSPRSIIGKLVSLNLYEIPIEEEKEPTVKQMVRDIENYINLRFETENMNKKENVKKLWEWFKQNEK